MSEITGTPALNKALAEFQAALPRVGKGETAKVPGKDGKTGYSYKYADLADISQVALPLLGKFGLAFTAKPTMRFTDSGAMFVLHYRLTHSSGEADEGFYELPSPAKVGPQVVGSHITYARRYCLCAVTGIHPDGEDDDGAVAQAAARSAGDAWDNAAPAQPRRSNGQANGHANGNGNGQRVQQHATGELDPDAQQYADEAHEALALSTLREIRERAEAKGKLESLVRNPATNRAGVLGPFLDYHERRLTEIDAALAQLTVAAKKAKVEGPELDIHVKQVTGATIEAATAAQLRQAAEAFTAGAAS